MKRLLLFMLLPLLLFGQYRIQNSGSGYNAIRWGNLTKQVKDSIRARVDSVDALANFDAPLGAQVFVPKISPSKPVGAGWFVVIDSTYPETYGGEVFAHSESGKQWVSVDYLTKKIVNVQDFGAVGDGVTDDTQAIQNAIDFASSAGTNTIRLPDGIYLIKRPIYFKSGNLEFIGNGKKTIIKSDSNSFVAPADSANPNRWKFMVIVSGDDIDHITIKDIEFKSNYNSNNSKMVWNGRIGGIKTVVDGVTVSHCYFDGVGREAVQARNEHDGSVTSTAGKWWHDIDISNNYFYNCSFSCINFNGRINGNISENYMLNCGMAIETAGGATNIENNIAIGCWKGFLLSNYNRNETVRFGTIISGNQIHGDTLTNRYSLYGINVVNGGRKTIISHNIISYCYYIGVNLSPQANNPNDMDIVNIDHNEIYNIVNNRAYFPPDSFGLSSNNIELVDTTSAAILLGYIGSMTGKFKEISIDNNIIKDDDENCHMLYGIYLNSYCGDDIDIYKNQIYGAEYCGISSVFNNTQRQNIVNNKIIDVGRKGIQLTGSEPLYGINIDFNEVTFDTTLWNRTLDIFPGSGYCAIFTNNLNNSSISYNQLYNPGGASTGIYLYSKDTSVVVIGNKFYNGKFTNNIINSSYNLNMLQFYNGNLGIGFRSFPNYKLDINGEVNIDDSLRIGSTSNAWIKEVKATSDSVKFEIGNYIMVIKADTAYWRAK